MAGPAESHVVHHCVIKVFVFSVSIVHKSNTTFMSIISSNTSPSVADTSVRSEGEMHVYLAGVGDVGTALLQQMDTSSRGPALRLIGACTSRRAIWDRRGLVPSTVPDRLPSASRLDWKTVVARLEQEAPRPLVFVDATGSLEVASLYDRLLQAGLHVVTPSKLANTQSQASFDRIRATAAEQDVRYRFEATVGAGLPVIQTIQDLIETGDRIRSVRGAVSGTLTFLFSALRQGYSFSTAVRTARERGYTEPDVRDDLSGEDVARKFLILARLAGYSVEREEVQVESLVPDELQSLSPEGFLDEIESVDDYWRDRTRTAARDGDALQYIGQLSDNGIEVGVQCVPQEGAFGRLEGQDNLFEITTDRYASSPLTIRGPGAGPKVTAAGVLSDVFKIARRNTDVSS